MKREILSRALNGIDDAFIQETFSYKIRTVQVRPGRNEPMHASVKKQTPRRILTLALAAALILSLAAAAYATGFFGLKAILIEDDSLTAYKWTDNGNGTRSPAENPDGGFVSITQPQDAPDDLDPQIREKIQNSEKAWAEWKEWNDANKLIMPAVYQPPEGCMNQDEEENEDGTWTVYFYGSLEPVTDEKGNIIDYTNGEILEKRSATAEEHAQMEQLQSVAGMGYPGYDYKYNVTDDKGAAKLEEIASRYGLQLRKKQNALYQNFGEQTGFLSRGELTRKIDEIAGGNHRFFRVEPTGYDKFYYWDEGTFCVSFYTTEDFSNAGTSCYLYNSPYGTLSSGYEIISEVQDVHAFATRTHITPDGTEVTVLQNGSDMFAYSYLENSFVNMQIFQPNGLSEAELDAIIDMVDFSVIG